MAKVDLDKITVDDDGKITGGLDDQYESLTNEYKDILGNGSGSGDGGLPNGTTPPGRKKSGRNDHGRVHCVSQQTLKEGYLYAEYFFNTSNHRAGSVDGTGKQPGHGEPGSSVTIPTNL